MSDDEGRSEGGEGASESAAVVQEEPQGDQCQAEGGVPTNLGEPGHEYSGEVKADEAQAGCGRALEAALAMWREGKLRGLVLAWTDGDEVHTIITARPDIKDVFVLNTVRRMTEALLQGKT